MHRVPTAYDDIQRRCARRHPHTHDGFKLHAQCPGCIAHRDELTFRSQVVLASQADLAILCAEYDEIRERKMTPHFRRREVAAARLELYNRRNR